MNQNAPLRQRGRQARIAVAALLSSLTLIWTSDARATHPGVAAASVTSKASPDGRWLAVRTQREGTAFGELSIVSLEANTSRSLEALRVIDQPSWDANGRLQVRVRDEQRAQVELCTIDPSNGQIVASERVDDGLPSADWARVERRKSNDGRELVRILWVARGLKFHLPVELGEFQLAASPGVVFYTEPRGNKLALLRHNMDRGLSEPLVDLEGTTRGWSVSPDERMVLVTEAEHPHRARVVDLRNGMLIDGPWPAESARWVDDDTARYVALVAKGRRTLVDRARDRQLDLGADQGAWPTIEPLPDGRFVVQSQQSIDLCDDQLRTLRTLVAKAD